MENQLSSTASVPRDLMSLTDENAEAFDAGRDLKLLCGGNDRLGIAPPSRSPSSSPSGSSSDTGDNDDVDDGDYTADDLTSLQREDKLWLRLATGEERRQLLGTEEESSDRHSSAGEEEEENVWRISGEQQCYYEEQFGKLRRDQDGYLSGQEARRFFEKSGLPIADLSSIWQLADVTQDGRLDKAEFFTAMHLTVLKRHKIEVPEVLPPCLHPSRILTTEDPRIKHPKAVRLTPEMVFAGVEKQNNIIPDGVMHLHTQRIRVDASEIKGIQRPTPRKTRPDVRQGGVVVVPSIPPPVGDDCIGPASLPPNFIAAPPPPPPVAHVHQKVPHVGGMPPPPPPRVPVRSHHARSSSLDLNKLDMDSPPGQPPAVPPRSSPAPAVKPRGHTLTGATDASGLSALMTSSLVINDARPSAFREYKRPGSGFCVHFTAMHLTVLKRHKIEVPEVLPPCLHPSRILTTEDPRIKHPKAVRLTPEMVFAGVEKQNNIIPDGVMHLHTQRIRVDASEIKGIQRPTPRKTRPDVRQGGVVVVPSIPPPVGDDCIGPASLPPNFIAAPPPPPPVAHVHQKVPHVGGMPPPPPPRVPVRSHHARSSSLDLNKLDMDSPPGQPPAVPPRSSPAPAVKPRGHTLTGASDASGLSALMTSSLVINDARPSAFREYKRPGSDEEGGEPGAAWTRSLCVLNWEDERKDMKERVAALLARIPLQNSEATREEVSAAVKWLQERRQTINAEIAELQSDLTFLVASRQVMEQSSGGTSEH
ncbi:unnamed protein product [Notodromas monacha]|uniref:Uncharacterized protein n=1 Tax=Notodromas monacha TaxID=399045 RepID=A0A7R9GJA0_9CRUS|nr:unnamed protein product [Notodromas monacha]CAG0922642.1 unnamed protein product [Notodromas monacha]